LKPQIGTSPLHKTVVITAFYNNERFLRLAVESVARQTVPPDEHILIDDCSTDGSRSIAEKLAKQYPYIRLYSHATNLGYPSALNTGIDNSTSDFVAILDGDDIALPNWLETVLPVISEDPEIGAVGGGCIIMTEEGHITGHRLFIDAKGDVTSQINEGIYLILHPGTVFRRSCLESVGGYNSVLKSLEDADLYLNIASISRIVHVGEPLILYRRLRNSQSRKSREFKKLSSAYIRAKSELLRKGFNVTETNRMLAAQIAEIQHAPRLQPQTIGLYHYFMASAFEAGGRRWMAASWFAISLWHRHEISASAMGIIRCIMPRPLWNVGKTLWNKR